MGRKPSPRRAVAGRTASTNGRLRDARSVFDAIRRIVRVLRLSSRQTEKEFGLSAAQLFVLQKLAEADGPLTPSELAERTLTDQSSISVVVHRLVESGHVTRTRSATDARSFQLVLTLAGQSVVRNLPDVTQGRLLEAMLAMPAADVRQLAQLLGRVVEATGLARERATMLMEEEAPAAKKKRATSKDYR